MTPNQLPLSLARRGRMLRSQFFPPIPQEELFPSETILHFSYHKCLTFYYLRILTRLSEEFGFDYKHFNYHANEFEDKLLNGTSKSQKVVLGVNNCSDLNFDRYPSYKGSHFIRDPRDLVISGYKYHLWTKEPWASAPDYDWSRITAHPYFSKYITNKEEEMPQSISYQAYLNQLDAERGTILEIIWRQPHFDNLKQWNFRNSNIIEKRFEDIIGNEVDSFRDIFTHYGFHPQLIERGLELVEEYSLKNQAKSDASHIRKGTPRQWPSAFTPLHKELFKQLNGDLLIFLGYENDLNW